jgi:mevalonate kinase
VTEVLVATIRQFREKLQELLYEVGVDEDKLENVVERLRISAK